MNRNGRNQNQLVAELLEVLSEQVNRLRAENKSLQAENARLLKIIREVSHSSQLALPVVEPVVPGITQDGMEL